MSEGAVICCYNAQILSKYPICELSIKKAVNY